MKNQTLSKCSSCTHWKNEQAELEYSKFYGICTCYKWKFNSVGTGDCVVLDRGNKSGKHMDVQRFENQSNIVPYGRKEESRYCFVTEEAFSCIHFTEKKEKR